MVRHSVSSCGGTKRFQAPQQPPRSAAPPPPPRSAPVSQQFKVPRPPTNAHPGVRRNSIIGKSPSHSAGSNGNNNIINDVKPKIQSTGGAPTPTAMLSRSVSGRFLPRASSSPSPSAESSSQYSDGMVSRGTFLPPPPPAYCYPSGCPGSRMT